MSEYLWNPRFYYFLIEITVGLLVVWAIAFSGVLIRKSSWKGRKQLESGTYNCWIFGFWLHFISILLFNSYQVYSWYFYLNETIYDFWFHSLTYLVAIILDIVFLFLLNKRKSALNFI